jgi:hypothetical protein
VAWLADQLAAKGKKPESQAVGVLRWGDGPVPVVAGINFEFARLGSIAAFGSDT